MSREIIPSDRVLQSIHWNYAQKALFYCELATLCGADSKVFNQALERNRVRARE
jgi:hypothetical protein